MVNLSLKVEENTFRETETLLKDLKQSRNAYINEAIVYYNQIKKRAKIAEQLAKESALVKASSMEVLREMEALENDYDY